MQKNGNTCSAESTKGVAERAFDEQTGLTVATPAGTEGDGHRKEWREAVGLLRVYEMGQCDDSLRPRVDPKGYSEIVSTTCSNPRPAGLGGRVLSGFCQARWSPSNWWGRPETKAEGLGLGNIPNAAVGLGPSPEPSDWPSHGHVTGARKSCRHPTLVN